MGTVSVVIPTYNRVTLVQEAIESVLRQRMDGVEVIVVDDGSTDGTHDVLGERYGERVRYFYQVNRGRSAARNYGIRASRGRYLLFLDSDDRLLPEGIEREAAYLDAHPEVDVVYTDGYFCDETGRNVGRIASARPPHSTEDILEALVISNVITACHSVMVRREALESVGPPYFDEALRGTEDEDLWIRLAAQGSTFAYLDVPTCQYRIHGSNASRHDPSSPAYWKRRESVRRSRFKILNADFFPTLKVETQERFLYKLLLFQIQEDESARRSVLESPRFARLPAAVQARLLYYLGVSNIVAEGELTLGRERLREAARLAPGNPKYRGLLLLSYLGRSLVSGVIAARRGLQQGRGDGAVASPIGQGGLRSIEGGGERQECLP